MGKALRPSLRKERKLKWLSKSKKAAFNNDYDNLKTPPVQFFSCLRKKRYHGTAEVIYAGKNNYSRYDDGKKLFYYPCRFCKGYHLTHKPGGDSVEIKKGS